MSRGRLASGGDRAAVGAVGRGGGIGTPSRGGLRRGARDHRPDQGRGADLEAGGGRVGRGDLAADGLRADRLRALPSVERLAAGLDAPHVLAAAAARSAIEARREELRAGAEDDVDLVERARAALAGAERASLRPVLNATGVIVHTNLGRAPLPGAARD